MKRPTPQVRNMSEKRVCLHCGGRQERFGGLVCLDDYGHGTLAPCLMCEQGEVIDNAQYGGKFWKEIGRVEQDTWENGLTAQHTGRCAGVDGVKCYRPAAGYWCAYHTDPVNRTQRPAWDRIVASAREAVGSAS